MIKSIFWSFLVIILTFQIAAGQLVLETRDSQSGEILQNVSLLNVTDYDTLSNGSIRITAQQLNKKDSIILFRHGYKSHVLQKPFPESHAVVYLSHISQSLDEVIVAVDQSAVQLRKVPSSVAFRDADDLLTHHQPVLNNQLNALPGVYMQSGTNNTNRLTIRGIGSRTPYSSNRIRAYLGSFPLTDGNGVTVVEDLPPSIIESVEVLKGPAASLYGSGLGGVVKINQRSFDDSEPGSLFDMQMGSFGERMLGGGGMVKNEEFAARVHVSLLESNGFRENNRYERQSYFFNARQMKGKTTFSFMALYTGLYGQIPSSLSINDYLNKPHSAADNWKNVEGYEKYDRVGLNLQARTLLGEGFQNKFTANFRFKDPYEVRPFNILDEQNQAFGVTNRLKYYVGNWQVTVSGHIANENYHWSTYEIVEKEQGDLINEMKDNKLHVNSGILAQWQPNDKMLIKGALSYNYIQYRLKDLQDAESKYENYNFDPVWSPSLGINYEPLPKFNLFVTISHGFSPPSLEETLLPDGVVNTELQPEKGLMGEFGARLHLKDFLLMSAAVYAMEITNMLVTRRVAEDQFMGINAGKVHHTGVEAQTVVKPLSYIKKRKVDVEYITTLTYSNNRFVEFTDMGNNYAGNQLPGIPQYHWHNSLKLELHKRYTLQMNYSITGMQYMNDDNSLKYSGHELSSLSVSLKAGEVENPVLTVSFGIRNLFNNHYASMILINAPSYGGSSPRYYYPGAPRNGYVALQFWL